MGSEEGTTVAADHPWSPSTTFHVAPTDGSTAFNTVRTPLAPIACWRLNDPAFDFDSSFILPAFSAEVARLAALVQAKQGCPAAIFAHADPAGSDDVNKTISDRRAIAVYALLTRQPPLWEDLYANAVDGDAWGTRAIQSMLQTIVGRANDDSGNPLPPNSPYYAGAIDGAYGPETTNAVKAFQTDSGLAVDGDAGPMTRKVLFGAYMDAVCTSPVSAGPPASGANANGPSSSPTPTPFRMQPADFLGGASAGPGDLPKMSLQGCGRFNPIVLLTSDEMNGDDQATRNADDAPNRRVLVFFFAKGTTLDAGSWPCPKVKESSDACKSAFWSDADQRRANGDARREYKTTQNTMACRFYDRFARVSPCERVFTYQFDLPPQKRYIPPQADDDAGEDMRIASNDPSFVPGPGRSSSPTLPSAGGANNYIVVSIATPPNIVFDHGFLDSDDGKHNLDLTKKRAPGASDYAALAKWEVKLAGAEALRPDLVDATQAYGHFLSATGTDWRFDYDRFVNDDLSGRTIMASCLADVAEAASLLNHSRGITASSKSDAFVMQTKDAIPVGDSVRFPYPVTEDWQKAIGAHVVWIEASVTVRTDSHNRRFFDIEMTLHGEDQYNFNPTMKDIVTGIPDSENGRFEITGLAKEFRSVSTIKRKITFSEDASFVPAPGAMPAPSDLKMVQPR